MRELRHPTYRAGGRAEQAKGALYHCIQDRGLLTPQASSPLQHATSAPLTAAVSQGRACAPAESAQGHIPAWTAHELRVTLAGRAQALLAQQGFCSTNPCSTGTAQLRVLSFFSPPATSSAALPKQNAGALNLRVQFHSPFDVTNPSAWLFLFWIFS